MLSKEKFLMLADVRVDNKLLVFANTIGIERRKIIWNNQHLSKLICEASLFSRAECFMKLQHFPGLTLKFKYYYKCYDV